MLLLLLSPFSRVRLCVTPQTAVHQAPPSPGFSRQEHWSGLPFPSPMHESEKWKWSHSVVSYSSRPPCFLNDPVNVSNLISGSSVFSKTSLNIWKFTVHILLKPSLENFEYYFTSMWDECNCAVVWAFFGIAFLRYWNENWPFPVLWPLFSFPNLLAYWVQHFHSIIF